MADDDVETPRTIFWAGRQWCVTDFGLETVKEDRYSVEAERLGDLTESNYPDAEPSAERFRHIAEKTWVDIEDLAAAFAMALEIHRGKYEPLPAGALHNALAHARWEKIANQAFRDLATPEQREMGSSMNDYIERDNATGRWMEEHYPGRDRFLEVVDLPPRRGEP